MQSTVQTFRPCPLLATCFSQISRNRRESFSDCVMLGACLHMLLLLLPLGLAMGSFRWFSFFFLYVVLPDLPCGFCFIFVGTARHVRELCEMLTRLACLISRDMHHKSDDHE